MRRVRRVKGEWYPPNPNIGRELPLCAYVHPDNISKMPYVTVKDHEIATDVCDKLPCPCKAALKYAVHKPANVMEIDE